MSLKHFFSLTHFGVGEFLFEHKSLGFDPYFKADYYFIQDNYIKKTNNNNVFYLKNNECVSCRISKIARCVKRPELNNLSIKK